MSQIHKNTLNMQSDCMMCRDHEAAFPPVTGRSCCLVTNSLEVLFFCFFLKPQYIFSGQWSERKKKHCNLLTVCKNSVKEKLLLRFKTQGRAHRPFTAVNIWVIILDCIDLSLMLGSSWLKDMHTNEAESNTLTAPTCSDCFIFCHQNRLKGAIILFFTHSCFNPSFVLWWKPHLTSYFCSFYSFNIISLHCAYAF